MDFFEKDKNKNSGFNILPGDSTSGHGGYGVGVISLDNISPVMVDTEAGEAEVDMGALHARSAVERRIRFSTDKSTVPNGKLYWIAWVMVERGKDGPFYSGAGASDMLVDRENRRGYKILADHVNKMDKALKRQVVLDHMDARSKKILKDFLMGHNMEMWEKANPEFKKQLAE